MEYILHSPANSATLKELLCDMSENFFTSAKHSFLSAFHKGHLCPSNPLFWWSGIALNLFSILLNFEGFVKLQKIE